MQLVLKLCDELGTGSHFAVPVEISAPRAREIEFFPRTRDGDIHEPPFLFQRCGIVLRARRGHDVLFKSHDKDASEFKSLDRVNGGDGHIVAVVHFIGIRIERDLL